MTRLLGRGGMGAVWEASHLRLPGKRVAIKLLHADVAGDQESLARFRREAEIATRLDHPNIVEVHDFNMLPGGQPYLVLELLVGESLDARMRRGPLPAEQAIWIAGQIAAALAAAHRAGVVHRDLKPHNVYVVRREDEGETVKVLDFGISKIRGSQTVQTQDSTILGTPQYMAPEQALGNHAAVDARTDVFALGAIVYEMLAGQPAFVGQNVPEVVFKVVYQEPVPLAQAAPAVSSRIAGAVHQALSKKQEERFPDVTSFVEAMAGVSISTLRRQPVPAPPPAVDAGPADPLAATVDSGRRERESIPAPPGQQALSLSATEVVRRRSRWVWALPVIGLVVLGAAIAGVLIVAQSSQGADDDGALEERPASIAADTAQGAGPGAAAVVPADEAMVAADAPVPADAPAPPDATASAKAPADQTVRPPPRRSEPDDDDDADPAASESRRDLADAWRALQAGDANRAIVLTEFAIKDGAGPRAQALRARAYCLKGDLERAVGAFNATHGQLLRAQVKRYCFRTAGFSLGR
ncbi:MAG TPA: serine/threonine-protein kinase [Kofleriaceae bacterium]|nr:serine/threonine-protein kinase [Kofleriaceae bacterium]